MALQLAIVEVDVDWLGVAAFLERAVAKPIAQALELS